MSADIELAGMPRRSDGSIDLTAVSRDPAMALQLLERLSADVEALRMQRTILIGAAAVTAVGLLVTIAVFAAHARKMRRLGIVLSQS